MNDEPTAPDGPEDGLDALPPAQGPPQPDDRVAGMPREQAIKVAQAALIVVAVIIVGVVLLNRGKGEGGDTTDDKPAATADDPAKAGDGKRDWPPEVGGRPPQLGKRDQKAPDVQVAPDTKPGVYLWNDFDGWHLWVVAGPGVPDITGTMSSNGDIARAELAMPATGTVTVAGKVATFSMPASAPLSGFDFNPGFFGDQLVFTIDGPDGMLDPNLIYVGSKAAPAPFPLVIAKS